MLLPSSLLCFLLAALVIYSEASSKEPRQLKRLAHPTTQRVDIFPRNSGTVKRNIDSGSLRHDDSFRLTLSAFEETFHIHLTPNNHLIHPTARITYHDRDPVTGKTTEKSVPLQRESVRVYEGYVIHADHTEGRKLEDIAGVREGFSSYPERGWARVTVYKHEDGESPVYEGAFSADGVIHHIMTKENYDRVKRPQDPEAENLDDLLVIWRDIDIMSEEEEYFGRTGQPLPPTLRPKPHTCGHDTLEYNVDPSLNSALRTHHDFSLWPALSLWPRQTGGDDAGGGGVSSNFIDQIGQTAGCPKSQKILYMGVAADCVYVSKYGSTKAATEKILSDWNSASSLYKSSFNVSLGIIELSVQQSNCPAQADSATPWNVGCNTQIDQRLSLFSGWRGSRGDDGAGLWHLMSGCPTGQEVGIAWMATLCRQSASPNGGQTVSGTGVSTIGLTEWQVVAHEIGHNFGAIHDCVEGCSLSGGCCPLSRTSCDSSSGYIMSPTTRQGEYTFSPCSVGNICSLMGGSGSGAGINTGCLLDPGQSNRPLISMQMCGNGIVEDGEDCDPGSNSTSPCCDSSTCKFINGAKCDPASGTCCTNQCEFASAQTVCRPKKDDACDIEETCTGTSGVCPTDQFRPNGESCGSGDLRCASGTCTSVARQCQTVGASLGLRAACPQSQNTCELTCQNPNSPNSCVRLSSLMIDGSPCGLGGTCEGGQCKSGSWLESAKQWYRENLQISIPVTIAAGLLVLSMFYCCISSFLRRRQARKNFRPVVLGHGRPQMTSIPPRRQSRMSGNRLSRDPHQRLSSRESQVVPPPVQQPPQLIQHYGPTYTYGRS